MYDWRTFRPIGKAVILKADPTVKKTKGGIEIPDGGWAMEKLGAATARILRIGSQAQSAAGEPLHVGDRVVFRGFLKDAVAPFEPEDGCAVFLLHGKDLLLFVDDDVHVGAFK